MATKTYTSVRLTDIDADGNMNVIHPETTADDVILDTTNKNIPSNVETTQDLIDNLSKVAFTNCEELVFAKSTDEPMDDTNITSEVDDTVTSKYKTWSSDKLNDIFSNLFRAEGDTLYINLK